MKLWKTILFSLIPVFLVFCTGEIIARVIVGNESVRQRILRLDPSNNTIQNAFAAMHSGFYIHDRHTGYRLKNPADIHSRRPPHLPGLPKKPNEIRILCLGDSVTHGLFIPPEKTWPGRLQTYMDSWTDRSQDIVVYNGGVPGYSPVQCKRILQAYYMELQPDVILWAKYTESFDSLELAPALSDRKLQMQRFLFSSRLIHLTSNLMQASKDERGIRLGLFDASRLKSKGEKRYSFSDFVQWCTRRGVRSFFAVETLSYDNQAGKGRQLHSLDPHHPKCGFIPTLDKFKPHSGRLDELFIDVVHFTEEGADLYARIVSDYLQECWPCETADDGPD